MKQVYGTSKHYTLSKEDRKLAISAVQQISSPDDITGIPLDILRFDTVWYSRDCTLNGRRGILRYMRNLGITMVRETMEIHRKYKTKEVMKDTELSKYAVLEYWKEVGLSTTDRTLAAIVEAKLYLQDEVGRIKIKQRELAAVSGVALPTIKKLKH
jgi:DNA-binding Xre family transcriptional regulator